MVTPEQIQAASLRWRNAKFSENDAERRLTQMQEQVRMLTREYNNARWAKDEAERELYALLNRQRIEERSG